MSKVNLSNFDSCIGANTIGFFQQRLSRLVTPWRNSDNAGFYSHGAPGNGTRSRTYSFSFKTTNDSTSLIYRELEALPCHCTSTCVCRTNLTDHAKIRRSARMDLSRLPLGTAARRRRRRQQRRRLSRVLLLTCHPRRRPVLRVLPVVLGWFRGIVVGILHLPGRPGLLVGWNPTDSKNIYRYAAVSDFQRQTEFLEK